MDTIEDYRDLTKRFDTLTKGTKEKSNLNFRYYAFGDYMAQLIVMLRRGIAEGQTNHNVSMAGVLEQVQSILTFLTVTANIIPLKKRQVCCVFFRGLKRYNL